MCLRLSCPRYMHFVTRVYVLSFSLGLPVLAFKMSQEADAACTAADNDIHIRGPNVKRKAKLDVFLSQVTSLGIRINFINLE